jgi:hypothetical protein
LEKAVVNSALQGMSIFLQVAHSMAGKTIWKYEMQDIVCQDYEGQFLLKFIKVYLIAVYIL